MDLTSITVTGAYGRDYRDRESAIADWHAGKDFTVERLWPAQRSGTYISIRDVVPFPLCEVRIRYNHKDDVVILSHPVNVGEG